MKESVINNPFSNQPPKAKEEKEEDKDIFTDCECETIDIKGGKFSREQLEEAYKYVIASKRKQWKAGISTKLHEVERQLTGVKGAMDELKEVKNSLKKEVADIFMSNENELKQKVLNWAKKLETEKRIFQRLRTEDRERLEFQEKILEFREAEVRREFSVVHETIIKLGTPI